MSYIGSSAAPLPVAFAGMQGQSFNGGTNTFTLSRAVARTLDIDVVINNVAQNPYDGSYSVSGTTLTTAETVSAGVGNVYVIFRDAPIGSFAPIDGSVTPAKLDRAYVNKVGDTMTGPLVIQSINDVLTLESTDATARTTLKLLTNGNDWEIGARGSSNGTAANAFYIYDAAASAFRFLIDSSGNLLVGATTTLAGGTGLTVSTDGRSASATIGIKAHASAGYDARLYMECPGSNAGGLTYQRSTGRLYAYSQTENSGPYVVPNGTSWTTNSDARLKTDIEDISYGLSAVLELSPKQYKYKTGDKTSLGLIAQQAALVIPEIVEVPEDSEAMMGIEYTGLIPVLVKAIQEQQALITQLQADVAALQA